MRRVFPAGLALMAMALSGCAAQKAASVEPTVQTVSSPSPTPRPTASSDMAARGPAQVVHTIETQDKVVFLTIDDGLDATPEVMQYLRDNNIPVTVFLTTGTVSDWQYWKDFSNVASIQNHSIVHPTLPKLGEAAEEQEICGASQAIEQNLGQVPWMMRPPYGAYDATTLAAAGKCGLDWVVHWSVTLPADKLEFQSVGGSLESGDIILAHFRKDLADVLPRVVDEIKAQGFQFGRLEDYLPPRGVPRTVDAPAIDAAQMQMSTTTESRAYHLP